MNTAVLTVFALFPIVFGLDEHQLFLKSTRDFGVELLKVACLDGKNALISPASVSMMMALIQQGARGSTQQEFSRVLAADKNTTKIGYGNLTNSLSEKSDGVTLEWGNRVYTKPGLTLNTTFKSEIESYFKSVIQEINFPGEQSQLIADSINKWISESTHGQIDDVILPEMVNPDTIMLLVNVIYFRGDWRNRFREKNTKTEKFEKSISESVSAEFMYQKNKYYFGRNNTLGAKWVEIPFQGGTHKMLFILPVKRHNLNKVISRLTGDHLHNIIEYGDETEVRLRIPKFKLTGKLSLTHILSKMGIKEVFTGGSNLSGISPEHLQISEVFHQANIEVDERGSTASASTVVSLSRKLSLPETFRLDQPFLFFIIDEHNKLPLFAGKISDPTARIAS